MLCEQRLTVSTRRTGTRRFVGIGAQAVSGRFTEGDRDYSLAGEGGPQPPPALPSRLRWGEALPSWSRGGAALPSLKEGAEGTDL